MNKQFLDYIGLNKFSDKLAHVYSKGEQYTFEIPVGWEQNKQTVVDSFFLSDDKYVYLVSPDLKSKDDYNNCGLQPLDISKNGEITFTCQEKPRIAITVNVLRFTTRN